ncbi:MAG TPA: sensor histidine kinase [Polyangia bacterium]|nr:sensor histidine kinase [Polyangia bacterium]
MLSSLLIASIGIAGGTTIYQTSRTLRRELSTEYQLFAENRAFALRDNLQILEDELARLALLPPIGAGRGALKAASQVLSGAHENSVLYNTAVLLLSADGQCIEAEPDVPEFDGQKFGDRPWFRLAASGAKGPILRASDEPGLGRTIKIVQPIRRNGAFAGALVGVIALSDANLITPVLREHLPPGTDGLLIDGHGAVIFPADRIEAAVGTDWAGVIATAARHEMPGTQFGRVAGQETLFAWAPVQAGSGYVIVFAWPWRMLNANIRRQLATLFAVLIFGIVLASLAGLILSTYLTRPLVALAASAARIARGEPLPNVTLPKPTRAAEVGALIAAFEKMETAIERRDQELREGAASLERRVRERTQELVETQKALVDAERFAAMGKTSAAIAHEIKNVLNGLGMAVELILQDPANTARVQRLQAQVVGEIARLRDVIDSLLSFSRSPRIESRPVDLVPIIRRAVEVLSDVISDRSVTVSVATPPSLVVECDGHKVEGVLVNLIKNAAQAGRRVQVEASAQGDAVVVDVADDGPGLSEDARSHLFEPFFTTKPNGTGLGLPTSLRYVEAHGGTLESIAPGDGGGARFRMRLPQPQKTTDGMNST